MSKLLSTLLAATAMLALSGTVSAADQASRDPQSQRQDSSATTGAQTGAQSGNSGTGSSSDSQAGTSSGAQAGNSSQGQTGDMEAKDKQYSADLKKCNSMKGAKMQKCMDAAEKKHGQM